MSDSNINELLRTARAREKLVYENNKTSAWKPQTASKD